MKRLCAVSVALNVGLLVSIAAAILIVGGPRVLLAKLFQDQRSTWAVGRIEHFERLPTTEERSIVFAGDSHIQLAEWGEVFQSSIVKNRGNFGDDTRAILGRIDAIMAAKPKAIFLMVGINDLATSTPETVVGRVKEIIQEVHSRDSSVDIYLHSILPVNNALRPTRRSNEDITRTNETMQYLARDRNVIWVGMDHLFKDADGNLKAEFTSDGLHLNGAAYRRWFDVIRPTINAMLNR